MKPGWAGSWLLLTVTVGLACSVGDPDRSLDDSPPESDTGRLSVATSLGAGDPTALDGFERALAPRTLLFPDDHGAHPAFRTEWWYWIGNLSSEDGRRFGYQLTFFRSALAPASPQTPPTPPRPPQSPQPSDEPSPTPGPSNWATRQLYLAHLALTDIDESNFHSFERSSRGAVGLAGAQSLPFRVWLEDWVVEAGDSGEAWVLRAAEGPLEIELNLEPGKPRVLHGDRGLSRKGDEPGAASYYYSRTRMPSRGRILLHGELHEVAGTSWFDREWSTSLLGKDEVGWDWLGAQLESGRELMFFRLRRRDGSSARVGGTLVEADGSSRPLDTNNYEFAPLGEWTSEETGVRYPAAFRLELPAENFHLDIEPLLADQELRLSFVYWEGAVAVSGSSNGLGYLEMTGYGERDSPR